MNKLSRKFIAGITVILLTASFCSILFNAGFLEKYYLHQKRTTSIKICRELEDTIKKGVSVEDAARQIEESYKVFIAQTPGGENVGSDEVNNRVNDELRNVFQNKGVGFQKYWLWEEDFEAIVNGTDIIRLYNQEKLNYSLLVQYMYIEQQVLAVAMIIPNIADAFGIINVFLIFVNAVTIFLSIFLIVILTKKITKPLRQFEEFALKMGEKEFVPLEVHTKDELESVACNLNFMGNQLVAYQNTLEEKNREMKQLLDDVAHELKTPVSLVKLYAGGMKDGLDDGTFLQTIVRENDQMEEMINKLLFLTRIEKDSVSCETCDISALLSELIDRYEILAKERNMKFRCTISTEITVYTNKELFESMLSNLITNAVKYASGAVIEIILCREEEKIKFTISNESNNQTLHLEKIWNPYYVGEPSRNKQLAGTGLGLPMVKSIAGKLGYKIECNFQDGRITFTLIA